LKYRTKDTTNARSEKIKETTLITPLFSLLINSKDKEPSKGRNNVISNGIIL
jgi:hypothetical protein